MKPVTGPNGGNPITDEQILALRDCYCDGEGFADASGEYVPTTCVLEWCDDALSDPETEPHGFTRIRRNARARCADAYNARFGGGK